MAGEWNALALSHLDFLQETEIPRPTWDEYGIWTAVTAASRSTCTRARNGAVVFRDKRVISVGYNGALSGQPHCEHHDSEPCKVAVHAEANAVFSAARHGIALSGGTLFCTLSPCGGCAFAIVQSGITRVCYLRQYREVRGLEILKASGVEVWSYGQSK